MREGDVILALLPQADGQLKPRPAVLLRTLPPFNDWLACGISSQLHQADANFDEVISLTDSDYAASGIKQPSVVRLGFLAVLPGNKIVGRIGTISSARHLRLLTRLSEHLTP
jgi:mRNA interferase MazF